MSLRKLSAPPRQYDPVYEEQRNQEIEELRNSALTRERDIVLRPKLGIVLYSPNGTPWRVTVDDTGALTITAFTP